MAGRVAEHRRGGEGGATAAEYTILAALVAAIVVVAVAVVGARTDDLYCDTSVAMESAVDTPADC